MITCNNISPYLSVQALFLRHVTRPNLLKDERQPRIAPRPPRTAPSRTPVCAHASSPCAPIAASSYGPASAGSLLNSECRTLALKQSGHKFAVAPLPLQRGSPSSAFPSSHLRGAAAVAMLWSCSPLTTFRPRGFLWGMSYLADHFNKIQS